MSQKLLKLQKEELLHVYIEEENEAKKMVNSKKPSILKKHGRLFCEACEFDFASTYGEIGQGFIVCHHTIPVNTLEEETKTKLNDLVLLCSNCHRMVHAKAPWLTVEELKLLLAEKKLWKI